MTVYGVWTIKLFMFALVLEHWEEGVAKVQLAVMLAESLVTPACFVTIFRLFLDGKLTALSSPSHL